MIDSKRSAVIVKLKGGLGNQLFQYAAARSLALDRNADLLLDVSFYEAKQHRQFELSHFPIQASCVGSESEFRWIRKLKKTGRRLLRLDPPQYKEPHYHFDSALQAISLPCTISGYFQSPRYFEIHAPEIRRELRPPESLDRESQTLEEIIVREDAVSLHIRRGDYVSSPKVRNLYSECSVDYYNAALKKIPDKGPVVVFSDDTAWARQNLSLQRATIFAEDYGQRSAIADLWLMTKAKHHVIANSTFSWWGAWLGRDPSGITVAPEQWFRTSKSQSKDLIPETWIRL